MSNVAFRDVILEQTMASKRKSIGLILFLIVFEQTVFLLVLVIFSGDR